MSYRINGLVVAKDVKEGSVETLEIGHAVALEASTGLALKKLTGAVYFPLVAPLSAESCVADIQVSGLAKVKLKDGEDIEVGDHVGVDPATGEAIEVADSDAVTFMGRAFELPENGYVTILLRD